MTNNEHNDKELNDYLKGNSDLSKAYRASDRKEPAVHLDEQILSAAKEAVSHTVSEEKPRFHKSTWVFPVSVAAMVTLSVSLVVTMQREAGQPLINGSDVEMFDSATVIYEEAIPEKMSKDSGVVIDGALIKQNKKELNDAPVPSTLDAAADSYRAEEKAETLKARMKVLPAKKMMLKEKARSESEVLDKRDFSDEKIEVTETRPLMLDEVELDELKNQSQVDKLKVIESLWKSGDYVEAKQMFDKFKKENPNMIEEKLRNSLGANTYYGLLHY